MIITLKNANFTANNIGNVAVPSELSSYTNSAITASGNTGMTDAQKYALETFFTHIGAKTSSGLWSKLDLVYLPFIAGSLANSLVNYKTNSVDVTPDASYFELKSNGGLVNIQAVDSAHALKIADVIWKYNNRSVFFLTTEDAPTTSSKDFGSICAYTSGSKFKRWSLQNTGSNYSQEAGSVVLDNACQTPATSAVRGSDLTAGVRGISCDGENFTFMFKSGTLTSGISDTASSYLDENSGSLFLLSENYQGAIDADKMLPEGAILVGQAMTQTEMETLKTYLWTLYQAFHG